MTLEKSIQYIKHRLKKYDPFSFDAMWIKKHSPRSYRFIVDNIHTEIGDTDWDAIVLLLDRAFQKRWTRNTKRKKFSVEVYEDPNEVRLVFEKYNDKLYTFLTQTDKKDRQICDHISVRLIRISQKGNILAQRELVELATYLVDQWIEKYRNMSRWKCYPESLEETIKACIRRYRYTGSFTAYLSRTLEYSGRGLQPLEAFSIDEYSLITEKRKSESVVLDSETGQARMYDQTLDNST